jgi:hypothetical protein
MLSTTKKFCMGAAAFCFGASLTVGMEGGNPILYLMAGVIITMALLMKDLPPAEYDASLPAEDQPATEDAN